MIGTNDVRPNTDMEKINNQILDNSQLKMKQNDK